MVTTIMQAIRARPAASAAAVLVVMLLAYGAITHVRLLASQAEATRARTEVDQWKGSAASCSTALADQQGAVHKLVTEALARSAAAEAALAKAAVLARGHEASAAQILAQRTPDGIDPCVAARAQFDEELGRERAR